MRAILNRTGCLAFFSAVLVLLAAASPLKADTLFTNFGSPGQTFNGSAAYAVADLAGLIAMPFVAGESAMLTGAMLALGNNGTPPGVVVVDLYSDSGGIPGAVLDVLTSTENILNPPSINTFTCTLCPQLTAGKRYFITAGQDFPGDTAFWQYSNNDMGRFYTNPKADGTGPWGAAVGAIAAFDVDGTPVPEPSDLLLLSAGLLGLGAIARTKFARSNSAA
jgi:hypothetical protein